MTCNAWMPVKHTDCARPAGHSGDHLTAEAYERRLAYWRERYDNDPEYRSRMGIRGDQNRRLRRAGLTRENALPQWLKDKIGVSE